MFIEKIKSPGLAHLSYVIGSGAQAAVVDPRRDFDVYTEIAAANGARITHIFETHRNEDLVSGAARLAERTGASVYHGPNAAGNVTYARTTREGDEFTLGNLKIRVLETPGHTDDSLSFAFSDLEFGDDIVGVFTGDALFIGDVGRTDFYPDRAREVAGLLHDSLERILALGDQAVVYPAHGAGSVCGSGMAQREVSTIGFERRNNSRLNMESRDAFIKAKLAEHHEYPPYFKRIEALNLSGAPALKGSLMPPPLTIADLKSIAATSTLVDVRSVSAFLGAHLPGSLSLPTQMISAFAGWFLNAEEDLVLIADDPAQAEAAARHLARIGYDAIRGYLAPSLTAWAAAGEVFSTLPVVDATTVAKRLRDRHDPWCLLDVRGEDEARETRIPGSQNIYVGELPGRIDALDSSEHYTVMCGSGARATIAASILLKSGFSSVDLFLGSIGAWSSLGYATESV